MIVVERKNIQNIYENLKPFKRILIVGCGGCSGVYQVGGAKQADEIATLLKLTAKLDKRDIETKTVTPIRQCDKQVVESTLSPLIGDSDAILSLACGEGVQVIAEVFDDAWVFPANDTKFIGSQDREQDKFQELCSACGECVLDKTAGVCPITRCAKGLLNGPCGGQLQGKCEVDKDNDCAWILIWKRLKERGKMDIFKELWMPRDRRTSSPPRKLGGAKVEVLK
jgi:hypothetical protein